MNTDLNKIIGTDEKIMWEGKPNKKCFIFESIFNPFMPFALLWGIIDFSIIGFSAFSDSGMRSAFWFIIPFFLLHLMPVWIYLSGILLIRRKYNNIYYIVTDSAIYTSEGLFTKHINRKPFAEMSHIDLHRGVFDQFLNVGDIICSSSEESDNDIYIYSVSDYIEVYNMIKKLQHDIYSDIMYPNDKRPKENHGYNTEYKG